MARKLLFSSGDGDKGHGSVFWPLRALSECMLTFISIIIVTDVAVITVHFVSFCLSLQLLS